MVLFVFGISCWGIFLVACVLKTKSSWQDKHQVLLDRKIIAETEYMKSVKGAVNKVKEEKDNLQDVDSMLTRLLLDRGRVWREAKPQGVQASSVLVDTGFVPAGDEPLQIENNAVLYLFKEELITVEGLDIAVPVKYLGEFHVNAVNGGVISLEPSPITPPSIAAPHINDGSTWAIYEKIPVDGHRLFSETDIFDSEVVLGEDPAPLFGKMDQANIEEALKDTK